MVVCSGMWLVVDEEFLLTATTSNKNAFDWRRKEDYFLNGNAFEHRIKVLLFAVTVGDGQMFR